MDFCKEDEWDEPRQQVALHDDTHHESETKHQQVKETSSASSFSSPRVTKKQKTTLMELPGEVRNRIYRAVLARPTTTVIELDKDWKQPALSLTCHDIQSEMISFWFANYKCSFWPDRYGMEYSFSPLMKMWMTRIGTKDTQIKHLEINVRMPDHSRFSWQIKVLEGGETACFSEVSLAKVANRDNSQHLPIEAVPKARTRKSQGRTLARPKSSKSTTGSRTYANEFPMSWAIHDSLKYRLKRNGTRHVGLAEIEDILDIFNYYGLNVPENLDAPNPSWTEGFAESRRIAVPTAWAPELSPGGPIRHAHRLSNKSLVVVLKCRLRSSGAASLAPSAAPESQQAVPESQQAVPKSQQAAHQESVDSDVTEAHSAEAQSTSLDAMPSMTGWGLCRAMQNLSVTDWKLPFRWLWE